MNVEMNTLRLLGASQLIVFLAGLLSEQLLKSVVGTGGISEVLVNISKNLPLIQVSNLVALLNRLGIVTLGGILWYYLLHISRNIPVAISIWRLAAIYLLTIPTLLALLDLEFLPAMILSLPYAPFELVLGIWLMVKGFN